MAMIPSIEALTKRNDAEVSGTVTGSAGAETLNALLGVVTTESLTTAALTDHTRTLTNSQISAASRVFVSLNYSGGGDPVVAQVIPAAGSCTIVIRNSHATVALNAAAKYSFLVL